MDYYVAWPRRTFPKWIGITLGGVFTLIVVLCAGMIVHLLRPPTRAPLPPVVAVAPPPTPAPAPTTAPAAATPPATPAPVAQPAPIAPPAPVVAQAAPKKHAKHGHKRAVLAKRDGKGSRSSKTDIDRLLGL